MQFPAIRFFQVCQQLERGGLARAVAAEQGEKFALVQLQRQALDHIGQILIIFEPEFPRQHDNLRVRRVFCFLWNRL